MNKLCLPTHATLTSFRQKNVTVYSTIKLTGSSGARLSREGLTEGESKPTSPKWE